MNKNQLEGKLKQVKGDAKIWWGKATNNLSTELDGNKDKIKGSLLEQQGDLEAKFDAEMAKFEKAKEAFETRREEVNNGIKAKWDKFTNEDLAEVNGSFEKLSNKIKEKYNQSEAEVNTQIIEFMNEY